MERSSPLQQPVQFPTLASPSSGPAHEGSFISNSSFRADNNPIQIQPKPKFPSSPWNERGQLFYNLQVANLKIFIARANQEHPQQIWKILRNRLRTKHKATKQDKPARANSYDTDSHWLSPALPTACHEDVTMPASSPKSISRHYPERSDAYSFGVFLLELVSGQEERELYSSDSERTLAEWDFPGTGRGSREKLEFKHRLSIALGATKEIIELQHKEIGMKKAAAKGSKAEQKAKKKQVENEIAKLSAQLKEKHSEELASLGYSSSNDKQQDDLNTLVKAIVGVSVTKLIGPSINNQNTLLQLFHNIVF
ncbi:hypothetical protein Droror1_Dr00018542 [Drosera rotundifolia]